MEDLVCIQCGKPWYPQSGHIFKGFEDVALCGPHAIAMVKWMSGHLKRKWNKGAFYEEAANSIIAGKKEVIFYHDCKFENLFRPSGDVICDPCGRPYSKHPFCCNAFDETSQSYWLNVLCDGSHVKL